MYYYELIYNLFKWKRYNQERHRRKTEKNLFSRESERKKENEKGKKLNEKI